MEGEGHPRAEEVVRLLAGASYASRLYPPTSNLPAEAVARFVERANSVTTTLGPLRYTVDPHGFRIGENELGKGQSQVVTFAETLHSMQVGQLVIAPDITAEDAARFVEVSNEEPAAVRQRGVRSALAVAGVSRIAVIEVSLRSSAEEGILGVDILAVPLEELGSETLAAAEKWSATASQGEGEDDLATAIDRLEDATRDIASTRVAEALLRLDEQSRMRILAQALRADASGTRMKGMMGVLANMSPAALARLLTIVAMQANTEPGRLARALELPPEVFEQVAMLLAPSPRTEAECGVPPDADPVETAADATAEEDTADLDRQIAIALPSLASGKALATTVAVSRANPDAESIAAIGEALPIAARDGAFPPVREALRRLDELYTEPSLSMNVEAARGKLADPEALADVCRAPLTDADAAIAGEILLAAGSAGAEALLTYYMHAGESSRSLLLPVLRGMGEPLMSVAVRRLRTGDSSSAISILKILPSLGDKRVVPVIAQALENLDADVRRTAIAALASTPGTESRTALGKALGHWDPETRRFAIREIGRVGAVEALPALVRILEDINFLERNHELKKEVIKSMESLGSADAVPVLRRMAGRRFVFGRKNKELRFLAQRAIENLAQDKD